MNSFFDLYKSYGLKVDMELSTFCNAGCPQCSRTDDQNNSCRPKSWLTLDQISLETFKKWFPEEHLEHIHNFHFSGTYGDPGMCKDLYEIVEYITTYPNKKHPCSVSINTNGSMRDTEFWWKLSHLPRIKVIFDVDGIDQKMHSLYRQGTNLKKVLENLEAFADGPSRTEVFTVLFKHNENYLEDIQKMCYKLGADACYHVESNRFKSGPRHSFMGMNGEKQVLEQITREEKSQKSDAIARLVRDHRHFDRVKDVNKIECVAMKRGDLKINVQGHVYPCCYLSDGTEVITTYKTTEKPYANITSTGKYGGPISNIMQKYIDNKPDFMLSNKSIKDIVSHDWFEKDLIQTFKDVDSATFGCKFICGKCVS